MLRNTNNPLIKRIWKRKLSQIVAFSIGYISMTMPILLRDSVVTALGDTYFPRKWTKATFRPRQQSLKNTFSEESGEGQEKHLVLVGGGHAHAQVIKALNWASRPENLKVTLIDKQSAVSYSGMVPGCISNLYKPNDTLLHLKPLADWAGIEFIHDRVIDIDLERKRVYLESSDHLLHFDCISIDIGSTSRGLDEVKGARQYTIPTRPISKLMERIEQSEQGMGRGQASPHVLVIGGGAAGVELSFSLHGRWTSKFPDATVTLLDAGSELLEGESERGRQAMKEIMREKGINVKHEVVVQEVCKDCVFADIKGEAVRIPMTHCIWATGAGAHRLAKRLQGHGLAATEHSWIRVNEYLQSVSHPFVFAAGDCCNIEDLPNGSPPKAGVFAVRAGPVLVENLTRFFDGIEKQGLKKYVPQVDFMKLLVCGDGKALGFRFGQAFHGNWVMKLKDAIDNNFMNLFKAEYLPELKLGQPYDTSQYDAKTAVRADMKPEDAATLLLRTDDDVDYREAWGVLRAMTDDEEYRNQVLSFMEKPALATFR